MTSLRFPESLLAAWARDPDALTADPAALNAALPRRARLYPGVAAARGMLAFFFLLALLVSVFAAGAELRRLNALATSGVVAEGRVYGTAVAPGGYGRCYQWFQFPADGRRVTGCREVSPNEYAATHVGDTVTVTYPPGRPEAYVIGRVDRAFVTGRARDTAGVILGWMALALPPVLWMAAGVRRHLGLLRSGVAAAGRVTGVGQEVVKGGQLFVLSYRFETPEGRVFDGRLPVTLAVRDRYVAHGADPAITVLYDPADPRRSLPYGLITLAEPA